MAPRQHGRNGAGAGNHAASTKRGLLGAAASISGGVGDSEVNGGPTKKVKVPASEDTVLEDVLEGLDRAHSISGNSREMLRQMLIAGQELLQEPVAGHEPWHQTQTIVAGQLYEVLEEAEKNITIDIEEASQQIGVARATRDALFGRMRDAVAVVQSKARALDEAKESFAEASLLLQVAFRSFAASSARRARGEHEAREATELCAALEVALHQHYPPLVEGTFKEAAPHLAVLRPLMKRVPLDESLARAFPVAAVKRPKDRGAFDKAALNQFHTEFTKHRSSLAERASQLATEAARLRAEEATAEKKLEAARLNMMESSAELRSFEFGRLQTGIDARLAEEQRRQAADSIAFALWQRAAMQRELEGFRAGPLKTFERVVSRHKEACSLSIAEVAVEESSTKEVAKPLITMEEARNEIATPLVEELVAGLGA